MRFTQSEKMEIIKIVQQSELGKNRSLKELGIKKSTSISGMAEIRVRGLMDWHQENELLTVWGTEYRINTTKK